MKRFVLLMAALAMVFAASVSAQTQAPASAAGAAHSTIQAAPADDAGKKETKKTKMTKKTKRVNTGEPAVKPVAR